MLIKKFALAVIILSLLLPNSFVFADGETFDNSEDYTQIEIIPNNMTIYYVSPITINLSIYITPHTEMDTVSTELITFTADVLQCTSITWGNFFSETTFRLNGQIDNNAGTINGMVWGSEVPTSEPGYFANLTFDVINPGFGTVIIDTDESGVARDAAPLPFIITHNFTIFASSILLTDEYPVNQSIGLPKNLQLAITATSGNLIDMYWISNATGIWKTIGIYLDQSSGRKYMSCYGVIESPYDQELTYSFSNYSSNTYHLNTCPARDLGQINAVEIYTPSFSGTIQPIFNGIYGEQYIVSGSTYTDVTLDDYAPTEWTWDDIKNLDLYTSSATTAYVIVTYDLGFGEGVRVDWSINVTDSLMWLNKSFWYMTEIESPVISNPTPYDSELWNYYYPTLSADIYDPNGDTMNVSFYWFNGTDYEQLGVNQTGGNGTYYQATPFNNYSETYYWAVVANDNNGHETSRMYRFKMRDVQDAPYDFEAQTFCHTQINLSWVKPDYADNVRIQRRTDNYPTSISDGLNIYNGTGETYYDTSVSPGTKYYYSAWSWNNTDGTWSIDNATATEITAPTEVTDFIVTTIDYQSINLSWTKGTGAETTLIRRKTGSYPNNQSDGTLVYEGNETNHIDTGLGGNITYYYRAWAHYYSGIYDPMYVNPDPKTGEHRIAANGVGSQYGYEYITINEGQSFQATSMELPIRADRPRRVYCKWIRLYDSENNILWQVSNYFPGDTEGWRNFNFGEPIFMRADETYTIEIYADVTTYQSGSPCIIWGVNTSNPEGYYHQFKLYGSYGYYSCEYTDGFNTTEVGPPTVATDTATNIDNYVARLNGHLVGDGGESTTVGFIWENESGAQNTTIGSRISGQTFYLDIAGLEKASTYSYKAWAQNAYGYVEGTETNFSTKPYPPNNLTVTNVSYISVNLTWNIGAGADKTLIRFKENNYPNDTSDGYELIFTDLNWCYSEVFLPNTTYYFRAWSYNNSNGLYSTDYDETNITTFVGPPVINTLSATDIQNETATLRGYLEDGRGENCTVGVRWGASPGIYTSNVTKGIYSTGETITHGITGLSKGNTYYYQYWAENSVGWTNGSEVSFATKPEEPNSFSANNYGARQINLTWINGLGADRVLIKKKATGYPTSTTDGTTLFSGFATYCIDFPLTENSTWYYRIWSYNNTNGFYSTDNVSAYEITGWLPNITYMYPCGETNYQRPPYLEGQAEGHTPLNYTFYGFQGDAPQILGDTATASSGWSDTENVLTYEDDYALLFCEIGAGWFFQDYPKWVFGPALTVSFDDGYGHSRAELITGVILNDSFTQSIFHGNKAFKVDFHNYYTDEWSTYYTDYSQGYYWELPEPTYVDKINVSYGIKWHEWCSGGGDITVKVYDVDFVLPPEKIYETTVPSGTLVNCTWDNATEHVEQYSWMLEVFDGIDYVYEICSFETEGSIFTSVSPYDDEIVYNTPSHDCSAQINHTSGETMDIYFYYYNYSILNYTFGGQNLGVGNGTYQWTYPNSGELSTIYHWRICVLDSISWHNETYDFVVRDAFVPDLPTFNLTNFGAMGINITDISGDERTDSIMMRWKLGSYPISRTDGNLLFNGTPTEYPHSGLDPNTYYYYSAWAWNATDNAWSLVSNKNLVTLGPQPPNFNLSKYSKSVINLTDIYLNDAYSDTILIRAKIGSYPTNRSDGAFVMNSSASFFDHTGLLEATDYYYRAWAYDEESNWWSNPTEKHQKTNGPPALSNFNPLNGIKIDNVNPLLKVTVNEYNDEDLITVYFRSNYTGSWTTIHSETALEKIFQYQSVEFYYQDYDYWWSINATDGELWANQTLTFETGSMEVPIVTATTYNVSQINLSWIRANWTTHTWIQRKIDEYPTSRSDGENIYFGTGEYFEDADLNPGVLYRYTIWSYNSTLAVYSGNYTTTQNLTKPYGPSNFTATKMGYRTINLTWGIGEGSDNTVIVYKEDNYPMNLSDGIEIYRDNGTWHLQGDLKPDDYLNYYSPYPGTDNFGVYIGGGDPFNNSCDDDNATKWDLDESTVGNFSYVLGLEPQRVKGFAIMYQDFYEDPGTDWEAAITDFEVYNGTWHHDWNGKLINNGSEPEWFYYESPIYYDNVTEVRFSAWTEWITPNIYEVLVGKLGYVHCFKAWGVVTKGGITQYSDDYQQAENKTEDTPINIVPEISNMHPLNETMDLGFNPVFNVTIADPEGLDMNISWQYLDGAEWIEFGFTSLVPNGTYQVSPTGLFDEFNTTYHWRVVVNDTADIGDSAIQSNTNISDIFWFKTRDMHIPNDPTSFDAEAYLWMQINLSWTYDSDEVYIERNTIENWDVGEGAFTYQGNGTYFEDETVGDDTTYYYQIWGYNTTDSTYSLNYLADNATTLPSPNDPPYEPLDGYVTTPKTIDETYMDVYDITMHCLVTDPDGDDLDVHFYWGNDTLIGTIYGVENNTVASLFLPDHWSRKILGYDCTWVMHDTMYYWYAIADDGEYNASSDEWDFRTCQAWDLNIDRRINYLDISHLVAHYLNTVIPPGSKTWDINENGPVNYLDVSLLVSHYLQTY